MAYKNLTWTDIASAWTHYIDLLADRFPNAVRLEADVECPPEDIFVAHLAVKHDLTIREARDEIANWLLVQSIKTHKQYDAQQPAVFAAG